MSEGATVDFSMFNIDYGRVASDLIDFMSPAQKQCLSNGTVPPGYIENAVKSAEQRALLVFPGGKINSASIDEFKETISLTIIAEAGSRGLLRSA